MLAHRSYPVHHVNCRIGSLENYKPATTVIILVNCRIGSLEKINKIVVRLREVNCRIGSLETGKKPKYLRDFS